MLIRKLFKFFYFIGFIIIFISIFPAFAYFSYWVGTVNPEKKYIPYINEKIPALSKWEEFKFKGVKCRLSDYYNHNFIQLYDSKKTECQIYYRQLISKGNYLGIKSVSEKNVNNGLLGSRATLRRVQSASYIVKLEFSEGDIDIEITIYYSDGKLSHSHPKVVGGYY